MTKKPTKKPKKLSIKHPEGTKPGVFRVQGIRFFLTYPDTGFSKSDLLVFHKGTFLEGRNLEILEYVVSREFYKTGQAHYHVYLRYNKRLCLRDSKAYDFGGSHPNIQVVRNPLKTLEYLIKTDVDPLTNLNLDVEISRATCSSKLQLYDYLKAAMLRDPSQFRVEQYIREHNLDAYVNKVSNWASQFRMLKLMQEAQCNLRLKQRPGIRRITPELVRQQLTPSEQELYHSWHGYQRIVDYLNQVAEYGFRRPFKTKNLLLVGPPNVGKTSLILEVWKHTAVYPVGVQNWFPRFQNEVYRLFFWDEFRPQMMDWQQLLVLLQGLPFDLPYKGGSTLKTDNQLWFLTSNQPLRQHVFKIRRYLGEATVDRSQATLRARVEQVVVTSVTPLFILQKLIHPAVV